MITQHIKSFFERRGFVLGGDLNKNDRAGALHRAWGHVFTNHIHGDYLEFGVYQGTSFIESYKQKKKFDEWLQGQLASPEEWRRTVAQRYSSHKTHFHGLDTFEGMPENAEGNASFAQGTYVARLAAVREQCLRSGMPSSSFTLYPGLFNETVSSLAQSVSTKVAIVNIDCDIYGSAVDALAAIGNRLQVGCVLLFDDYNAYSADNRKGERLAFREFCDSVPFKFEPWFAYQYSGQSFLCVED